MIANEVTMAENHPITPPPELVQQWVAEANEYIEQEEYAFANRAAQWGADKELEACCKWLPKLPPWSGDDLRRHRRPKPPSLKEQALEALASAPGPEYPSVMTVLNADQHALIRRALEQLPEDK